MRWRSRPFTSRNEAVVLGSVGLLAFLVAWEGVSRLQWLDPVLISSPSLVAVALKNWAVSGALWRDLGTSLLELVIAFGAAAVVGIPLGVIMGWSRPAEYSIEPFLWMLYASPTVSLWPLFIIWFGIGMKSIVILAFLFAVVQVTINTFAGVRGIDPLLIRCARSFNAGRKDLFFKFTLPGALPLIIAGSAAGGGEGADRGHHRRTLLQQRGPRLSHQLLRGQAAVRRFLREPPRGGARRDSGDTGDSDCGGEVCPLEGVIRTSKSMVLKK